MSTSGEEGPRWSRAGRPLHPEGGVLSRRMQGRATPAAAAAQPSEHWNWGLGVSPLTRGPEGETPAGKGPCCVGAGTLPPRLRLSLTRKH